MRNLKYVLCACTLLTTVAGWSQDHSFLSVSQANRTITDVDPLTGKVLAQAELDGAPADVVFSWDEQHLFVSVPDQGYIAVLDAHTLKESSRLSRPEFKSIPGSTEHFVALATTPDYRKLLVSVPGGLEMFDQKLMVYNPEFKEPVDKVALPGQDGGRMMVHGPTNKLYHAFRRENQLQAIDAASGKLLKSIPVPGGPMDLVFMLDSTVWVACADGSVAIVDTNKDDVIKTLHTGGKGAARITVAPDVRFIAVSHDDTGDVSVFQPVSREVIGTIKVGKGPLAVALAPVPRGEVIGEGAANPGHFPPTSKLYVTTPNGFSTIDLEKMAVESSKDAGQNASLAVIHYTYPDAFTPPRESTAARIQETDLYTLYDNSMFNYDVSPIHEHRTDMIGIFIGDGTAKIGCWKPECPTKAVPVGPGGLPYTNSVGHTGEYTAAGRLTLHIEEGASPTPRRQVTFMPKKNYYRETNPKKTSDFEGKPGFKLLSNNSRSWVWGLMLIPGEPITFPRTDYAFVYLGGGLVREIHNKVPDIQNRYFGHWNTDSSEKTVEAISNRVQIAIVEFK